MSGTLVKFFAQLPHVRRLEIENYFLKYLADGIVSGELPKLCLDLTFLSISINLNAREEVLTSFFMLRSSPSLQELEIEAYSTTRKTKSFKVYDNCIGPFAQLRNVTLEGISGTKSEVDFIRFLLSNSPMLEKMTVTPADDEIDERELVKQLLQLKRASASAESLLGPFWLLRVQNSLL